MLSDEQRRGLTDTQLQYLQMMADLMPSEEAFLALIEEVTMRGIPCSEQPNLQPK